MRKPPSRATAARRPAQAAGNVGKGRPAVCAEPPATHKSDTAKTLIVARHFAYDPATERVNPQGNGQMLTLAGDSRRYLRGRSVGLISSMDPHCIDSALVLAKAIMIKEMSCHDVLLLDDQYKGDEEAVLALIQKKLETVDVLIVMTHMGLASSLPVKFSRQYGLEIQEATLRNGEARVLVVADGRLTETIVRQ